MNNYNMLIHYASFRKAVVSDVPDGICLEELKLDDEQKELIINGLPMVKDCIISIYNDIIEYAGNPSFPRRGLTDYQNSGDMMKDRRDASEYVSNVFYSLYSIISNGEYDGFDNSITISKESLKLFMNGKQKFKQSLLVHLEHFCRIEYLENNIDSDWRKCDSIRLTFDDKALCFTLWHMIQNNMNLLYFQYGDFRIYSKSEQTEDKQNRFQNGVRLKALGNEKYNLYKTLCSKTREILNIDQTGENTYQGHGFFMILNDYGNIDRYKNVYENTRISLCIQKDRLTVDLRLGFDAFGKLPEIIEKLTPDIRNGFLSLHQCNPDCPHKCTSKRFAVFKENIYTEKFLKPCQYDSAACNIENETDIQSIILIYEHIKKYTHINNKKHRIL